jgi:hypothetical protein
MYPKPLSDQTRLSFSIAPSRSKCEPGSLGRAADSQVVRRELTDGKQIPDFYRNVCVNIFRSRVDLFDKFDSPVDHDHQIFKIMARSGRC